MQSETFTIDANGRSIGRVATEAASFLMGKHRTDMARNINFPVTVTVVNASKLHITEKDRTQKEYDRYSGYPDGRKVLSMGKLIARSGHGELVKKAVYGMLPGNKLRALRMKKLIISE